MRIAAILALIMCTFSFGEGPSKKLSPLPKELQGDAVPSFFVLAPDNETSLSKKGLATELKRLRAKRVVFSFFATWCDNCKTEFFHMKENAAKLKEKGVQVYLIDVGENIMQDGKKVSNFVKEYAGNKFPLYFDQNANLLRNFGIIDKDAIKVELPMVLIMDANLRVLDVFTGIGDDFPQILWENL